MRTLRVAARECGQIARNPIYLFCMVVFPIVVTFFFTSILDEGQPAKLPVGVVDQDRSEVTRAMVRRLNSFQTTQVKDYYPSVADARKAIQELDELDLVTQDMLIGQVAELEKFQWFVRAHLESAGGELASGGAHTERQAAAQA